MDLHRFRDEKRAFSRLCKLVTFYLNRREKLRNKTNHGIVVLLNYIDTYVLISIYIRRAG